MLTKKRTKKVSHYALHRYTLQVAILIVVVLGLSAVSLYAWQVSQAVNATYNKANQAAANVPDFTHPVTYTDTAKVFTLVYPSSWRIVLSQPGGEGKLPDWTKESHPFQFIPAHQTTASTNSFVEVQSKADEDRLLAASRADKFHMVTAGKINGYTAFLDKVVFVGPSNAERYTDDYYLIEHENTVLVLFFRESYYHNYPPENWDDSGDAPTFVTIVNSVKFLR